MQTPEQLQHMEDQHNLILAETGTPWIRICYHANRTADRFGKDNWINALSCDCCPSVAFSMVGARPHLEPTLYTDSALGPVNHA